MGSTVYPRIQDKVRSWKEYGIAKCSFQALKKYGLKKCEQSLEKVWNFITTTDCWSLAPVKFTKNELENGLARVWNLLAENAYEP